MGGWVGKVLGFSNDSPAVEQVKVDPSVTNVSSGEVDKGESTKTNAKRKRGLASTSNQGVVSTLMGSATNGEAANTKLGGK